MMELVLAYYDKSLRALEQGAAINELVKLPVREKIGRFKYIAADVMEKEYQDILINLDKDLEKLLKKEEA